MATTYTIVQGAHNSKPSCFLCGHMGITYMSKEVVFSESCLYDPLDLGSDASDINKLFGFSYGLTSYDSIRVGWRSKGEYIELLAYLHVGGKRYTEPKKRYAIFEVPVDPMVPVYCSISVDPSTKTFVITAEQGSYFGACVGNYPFKNVTNGWYQFPYFGGNRTAPTTMQITLK